MSTAFDSIRGRFFRKIEKDIDFFSYYNVSPEDAMLLAETQADGYIYDAIDRLTNECTPDIDFSDYDEETKTFNVDLTKREIGLLADIMREVYFERDFSLLKAFKISMTPSDLNQFSPASERKTYTDMVKSIQLTNDTKISQYSAIDRVTGKPKMIDYSQSSE